MIPLPLLLACHGPADSAQDTGLPALPDVADLPLQAEPPDPFVTFFGGEAITSAEDWWQLRAPEVDRLLEHYLYGLRALPLASAPAVTVLAVHEDALDGLGRLIEVEARLPDLPDAAPVPILLALPAGASATQPVPLLLGLNKCGNHSITDDVRVALAETWAQEDCPAGRGGRADYWSLAVPLAAGIGVATVHQSVFMPDDPDRMDEGVRPLLALPDAATAETAWGAVGVWAWGLQQTRQALAQVEGVDGARIAAFGHSRRGKAALWAAAGDPEIAAVWAHQSGTAGAALTRDTQGETVAAINALFPHWFDDIFPEFAGQEERLPFDQHLLLARVAPRPLLVTDGADDAWASPDGARQAVDLAAPVWALLDADAAAGPSWQVRPGDHSVVEEDWVRVVAFLQAQGW